MKKSKTTNRNLWSNSENKTLMSLIKSCDTINEAFALASAELGRTKGACAQHYYKVIPRTESNTERKGNPRRFEFNIKSYSIKNGKLIVTI